MGTAAMGLAGGVGGFGNAAMEYGKQIRGILEQRREGLANFLSQQMAVENDPQRRAELAGYVSDLYSGKDMSKIAPALFKTVQSHAASDAALGQFGHQVTGGGGTPPPPPAGPAAPGQPVGSGGPPPLAQASTSLVQPQAQNPTGPQAVSQPPTVGVGGEIPAVEAKPVVPPSPAPTGNIPSVMGAASPTSPLMNAHREMESLLQGYHSMYAQSTPAMRPQILAEMNAEVARLTPFLQKQMQMDNLTGYQEALYKLQGDKQFQALPFMAQIQHLSNLSQAYGFQPSSLPYGYMGAANRIETKPEDAAALEQKYPGILAKYRIDPNKTPVVNVSRNPMMQMQGMDMPVNVEGVYPGTTTVQTPGGMANAPKLPGVIPGAVPPVLNRPVGVDLATGQRGLVIPSGGPEATPIPGSTVPGLATTERSQSPTWGGGIVSEVKKIPAGSTTPPVTPVTPGRTVPPIPHGAAVPLAIRPFSENVPIDHLVHMIANDATNEKMISPRGPFSDANPSKAMVNKRMAELGIDPNNVTGSMRERSANAKLILQHLDEVDSIINEAERKGELGLVATRWNDFLTNKLGVDPTPDHIFSKLSGNQSFLSTAVAMAHGGLRGGGSPQMVAHWEEALKAADPETLKSKLRAARSWMQGYASLVGEAKMPRGSLTPAPVAGAPQPFDANAARSKYNY